MRVFLVFSVIAAKRIRRAPGCPANQIMLLA
jgi:hypothetical protein